MKALILGTGSIGQRHMRNLAALAPGIEFLVVRKGGSATAVTRLFSARIFSTVPEALEQMPDLAVIATPFACHREPLDILIRSRVPTYVEKPIATTPEGLTTLAEEAEAADLTTQVGCNLRFLPSLQTLRQVLREGGCGRVVRAHLECGQWLPDWRPAANYRQSYSAQRALGGGVLKAGQSLEAMA